METTFEASSFEEGPCGNGEIGLSSYRMLHSHPAPARSDIQRELNGDDA